MFTKNVFGRVWQSIWSRCTSLSPALYFHHGARPSHLQIPQQTLKSYTLNLESLQTESQAHFYHFYLKWQQIRSQTTLMMNPRQYWMNVEMTFSHPYILQAVANGCILHVFVGGYPCLPFGDLKSGIMMLQRTFFGKVSFTSFGLSGASSSWPVLDAVGNPESPKQPYCQWNGYPKSSSDLWPWYTALQPSSVSPLVEGCTLSLRRQEKMIAQNRQAAGHKAQMVLTVYTQRAVLAHARPIFHLVSPYRPMHTLEIGPNFGDFTV